MGVIVAGAATTGVGAWQLTTGPDPLPISASDDDVALPSVDDVEGGATPLPEASPTPTGSYGSLGSTCTNDDDGYSVTLPTGWVDAKPNKPCRFIDNEVRLTSEPEIRIALLDVNYADWVDAYAGDQISILSRVDTTLAGHQAVAFDYTFVDAPQTEAYDYVVDLGGVALVLGAYSDYSEDFTLSKGVVDQIAATLVFP